MTKRRFRQHGVTIVEVVAVIVLVVVLVTVAFMVFKYTSHNDRGPTKARHQLRGIHQGLVIFCQSNKFYYPGFDSMGNPLPDSEDTTGNSGEGTTVEARYWILLKGDFFTPEYAISHSEKDPRIGEYPYDSKVHATRPPVTSYHYSFAMLDIDAGGQRVSEWKETANTQAIVMSDRNTGTENEPTSIHNDSKWIGNIVRNDNYVTFEQEPYAETKYGNADLTENDYLFRADSGDDAYLIYSGK